MQQREHIGQAGLENALGVSVMKHHIAFVLLVEHQKSTKKLSERTVSQFEFQTTALCDFKHSAEWRREIYITGPERETVKMAHGHCFITSLLPSKPGENHVEKAPAPEIQLCINDYRHLI